MIYYTNYINKLSTITNDLNNTVGHKFISKHNKYSNLMRMLIKV